MPEKMNNRYFTMITVILCMLIASKAFAQQEFHSVEVTFNKTSSIVFPTIIKSVDRGSRDVLAQKAKGVDNVLQLKAARENFPETNLTVITADGALHQLTVTYSRMPAKLTIHLNEGDKSPKLLPLIFQTDMTESELEEHATRIISSRRSVRFINERKHKINLSLNGIYIKENVIFYHFRVRNQSNINYHVDFIRFYIQDKTKVKRTASQEVDVKPLYVHGNHETIKGLSTEDVVYALEKFTIPEAKYLVIEMFEKNGGRNLALTIRNKTIVNAKLIK